MLEKVDDLESSQDKHEKAHAERLLKRIKSFKAQIDERAKGWKIARDYADGNPEEDGEKGLVRTNLVGSILETIQPSIYAKAPEIACTVDEMIDASDYALIKPFTETLQNALNRFLVKDAKLKVRGKSVVRSALTTTVGWVKVIYQVNKGEDPLVRNRINDTQDNLQKLDMLIAETHEKGGQCPEYEAKLYELKQQIDGLHAQLEVVNSEGLVVDVVPTEDIIILDDSCRDIDDFMQAGAIAHRIKMTVGAFKTQFKKEPPKGTKFYTSGDSDQEGKGDIDGDDKLIYLYEVWSMEDMTVYTLLEGTPVYVRPPYQPVKLGQQWYPFFGLQLRRVDGKRYPKSHVEQLIELQDEYNTRRTNAKEHRKKNIPIRILNKESGITNEEIRAINNRTVQDDVIGVSADANSPLGQQLASLPEIPYNPLMYDTTDILFDMEKVGNAQDASTGAIRVAKTATEAEIASAGMQGRTGESLDVIEDWLTEIATYSAQLLLQNVTPEIIKQQFGQKSVWPELSKEEYFNLVKISIRAGSTARPNKMRERDQWMQLLPLLEQSLDKLMLAKQQGQKDVVDVIVALLDETLHRFDERLSAKELLGISDETEEGQEQQQPGQPGQESGGISPEIEQAIQEQQQQMQQQIDTLTKENGDLRIGTALKQQEIDLKSRDLEIKEQDIKFKQDLAYQEWMDKQHEMDMTMAQQDMPAEVSDEDTMQEQVNAQLIQETVESNKAIQKTLDSVVQRLEVISAVQGATASRKKIAIAKRQPDGSFIMQSEEE